MEKQQDQRTDQEELKTYYMAQFPHTWGISRDKNWMEAIENALEQWHEYGINEEGKVKLWMAEVSEDFELNDHTGAVRASSIENEEERMIDADILKLVQEAQNDIDVIIESIITGEMDNIHWEYMEELEKP